MAKDIHKELAKEGFKIKNNKRKKSKIGRAIFYLFLLAIIIAIFGGLWGLSIYRSLPEPKSFGERVINESTKIYDRTGKNLLYEIHGEEKRTVIPLDKIPKYTQQAIISIEDAEFYNHPALDWRAMLRAMFKNITTGRISQGGSTITQQLAKNAFLTLDKTIVRKVKDMLLAIKLEKQYSKNQILDFYINQISFGSNLYGIESASQSFFNKSASELTIAESSILAAIIQLPTYYSPYGTHTKELFERQGYVLKNMYDYGYIDKQQLESALSEEIKFAHQSTGIKAPHFVMFVKEYIEDKYGKDFTETAGLKITTTLDLELQELAEQVVAEGAKSNEELYGGKNAALIAQDPKTGQILVMVGSRDYFDIENEGNFNVLTAHRQPGSSFKPFAYLAAFEKGYLPDTIVFDTETNFDTTGIPNHSYIPQNYDHKFRGPVDLRHALAQSMNVPAVKVAYLVGVKNTIDLARKFGLTTFANYSDYGLSLVLGGGDVRPIEMVGAYSVLAQAGVKHKQEIILKIEDSKGNILEEYKDELEQVFDSKYINMINDVLSDNEARVGLFNRQNRLVIPGYQVAAKTGTTQDYRDAWIFGYTPNFVAGVWAGNNDFSPMHEGGGSILAAVPMWYNFMSQAILKYPAEEFIKPEYEPAGKPILDGQFMSSYQIGDQSYPQIHNILYWLDKNNPRGPVPETQLNEPQFENWETPVLDWVKENFSNMTNINQPLPPGYGNLIIDGQKPEVKIISPTEGYFIPTGQKINLQATINAPSGVKRIRIFFNEQLISETYNFAGNQFSLEFFPNNPESQNKIKVEIENNLGNILSESVIVFY